jgi:hypothetical protein
MPHPRLVSRFVVALYQRVGGAANPWRRANDVARYDGIPMGKLDVAQAASAGLGSVEIQDSPGSLIVIQARDGSLSTDRRPMGEDGTALPGQANGPRA